MFYALGSIIFILAMAAAILVMIANFAHYRHAMMAALRSLSLDGLHVPQSQSGTQSAGSFNLTSVRPQAAA